MQEETGKPIFWISTNGLIGPIQTVERACVWGSGASDRSLHAPQLSLLYASHGEGVSIVFLPGYRGRETKFNVTHGIGTEKVLARSTVLAFRGFAAPTMFDGFLIDHSDKTLNDSLAFLPHCRKSLICSHYNPEYILDNWL